MHITVSRTMPSHCVGFIRLRAIVADNPCKNAMMDYALQLCVTLLVLYVMCYVEQKRLQYRLTVKRNLDTSCSHDQHCTFHLKIALTVNGFGAYVNPSTPSSSIRPLTSSAYSNRNFCSRVAVKRKNCWRANTSPKHCRLPSENGIR